MLGGGLTQIHSTAFGFLRGPCKPGCEGVPGGRAEHGGFQAPLSSAAPCSPPRCPCLRRRQRGGCQAGLQPELGDPGNAPPAEPARGVEGQGRAEFGGSIPAAAAPPPGRASCPPPPPGRPPAGPARPSRGRGGGCGRFLPPPPPGQSGAGRELSPAQPSRAALSRGQPNFPGGCEI